MAKANPSVYQTAEASPEHEAVLKEPRLQWNILALWSTVGVRYRRAPKDVIEGGGEPYNYKDLKQFSEFGFVPGIPVKLTLENEQVIKVSPYKLTGT